MLFAVNAKSPFSSVMVGPNVFVFGTGKSRVA